jgi:hypothetical protein
MNNKIYHTSSQAVYWDNGDGSLRVTDLRGNPRVFPRTIAFVKNDEQGRKYIEHLKSKFNRSSFTYLYRCPKTGQYPRNYSGGALGHVKKSIGLVISVRN